MSGDEQFGLAVAQQSPLTQGTRILDILRRRTLPGMKPSATAASRVVQVSLVHFVTSESGAASPAHICQRVLSEKLDGDALEAELCTLAEELASEASYHASCAKTTQMYAIVLYGKNDVVLQQHRFNAGPRTMDMLDGDTEPANLSGITTHLMRHNEVAMRMNQESWRMTLDLIAGENARLREESKELRAELKDMRVEKLAQMDLMEALKDGKARRDAEAAEAAAMNERGERLLKIVETRILPEVVAKYSTSAPAKTVLETLSVAQVIGIAEVLDDKQKKAFWALLPEEKQAELAAASAAEQNGAAS